MTLSPVMRYPFGVCASVVVTATVFWLMQVLIQRAPLPMDVATMAAVVEIYQPPPPTTPPATPESAPPPIPAAPSAAATEPSLPRLHIAAPTAPTATKLAGSPVAHFAATPMDISLPAGGQTGLGVGDGTSSGAGERFVMQSGNHRALAKKIAEADAKGAEGYKEIVPFATRQPDIPQVAWERKIDGWVLVAFTVNGQGRVENIQVLDANPPGIFEGSVTAALQGWQYDMADIGGGRAKVQLTQKIELHWRDYPNNSTPNNKTAR